MIKYLKYLPWVLVIIGFIGTIVYYNKQKSNLSDLISIKNEELQQADLTIGRARTEILNQKEVSKAAIENIDKQWKDEINKRKALIVAYGELQIRLNVERQKVKTITEIVYRDKNTEKKITIPKNKLFVLTEDNKYQQVESLSYSYSDFRISINGDAVRETLSYKLHQKFQGQLVETKLPTGGSNHYIKIYEVDDKNKKVAELELSKFEVLKAEDLPNKMMWWNPKLDLGIGGGINQLLQPTLTGELGFSISSWGKTEDDITWRFFRFGVGTTNHGFSLTASPAQLNIGKFLPLISNLWVTPFGGVELRAPITGHFGLGLSVVF